MTCMAVKQETWIFIVLNGYEKTGWTQPGDVASTGAWPMIGRCGAPSAMVGGGFNREW